MARYFLKIAYNGGAYHGWQVQPESRTVQQELNRALAVLLRQTEIATVGCGRTDTGVHAREFFLHFDTEEDFSSSRLLHSLNGILDKDIAVFDVFKVEERAHVRFDATSRTYEYHIHRAKDPFLNGLSARIKNDLDLEIMQKGADLLLEYEDFTSFSKLHTQTKTNNCYLKQAKWNLEGERIIFTITADRFLRNMVRAIVGTLLELGEGKLTLERLREIIESKDRCKAGVSAPACGLYLTKIGYPYPVENER